MRGLHRVDRGWTGCRIVGKACGSTLGTSTGQGAVFHREFWSVSIGCTGGTLGSVTVGLVG